MKEKKCKVCSLFDERKFSDEIRFDINKLIKSKEKLEFLNKQTGFNFTNKHYYKVHNDTCLLNFEIPITKQKIILNQNTSLQVILYLVYILLYGVYMELFIYLMKKLKTQ